MNDMELLREYALRHFKEAFPTLVTRHIDLVYAAAWRPGATAFVKLMQGGLDLPRPGAFFTIWFDSHPCIADRVEFCNTYHPWETGKPSKYEKYFLPEERSGRPPTTSFIGSKQRASRDQP